MEFCPKSLRLLSWLACAYGATGAFTGVPTTVDSHTGSNFPALQSTMFTSTPQTELPMITSGYVDHTMSPSHSQSRSTTPSPTMSTPSPTMSTPSPSMSTEPTGTDLVQAMSTSHVTDTSSYSQTTNQTARSTTEDFLEELPSVSPVIEYEDANGTLSGWHWKKTEWPWYLIIPAISGGIGIIGNLLVMIVLYQRRSAGRSTDTLIGGLAFADFVTSIFIIPLPEERRIPATWLGDMYCRIINTQYFLWVSVIASTYILMAISIERFIAISYPFYFNRVLTRRRVKAVIVFIWFLSVVSTIFAFFVELVDPVTNLCVFRVSTRQNQLIIGYYWFFLRMVIPMLTMLITQTLIARELHRQSVRFKDDKDSSTTKTIHLLARNRVLKMMLVVIIIYIVCWAPNQVAYMGYILGYVPQSYLGSPLHHTLTVLGFVNSCANPFIYTARHPQFRAALKGMFTGVRGGNTPLFELKMDSRSYGQTEQSYDDKGV